MRQLNDMLVQVGKEHLQFQPKEYVQLEELRAMLGPFKEATLCRQKKTREAKFTIQSLKKRCKLHYLPQAVSAMQSKNIPVQSHMYIQIFTQPAGQHTWGQRRRR